MAFTELPWVEWMGTLSLGIVILVVLISTLSASKLKLPPGPGSYPIVGSFPVLGEVRGEAAHQMFKRLTQKFGPIVFVKMGANPTIIISDSHMAKAVLKDQDHVFASRPYLSAGKYMGMNFESLVFSQMGLRSKRLRKIYNSELLSPKRVMDSHEVRENGMHAITSLFYEEFNKGQPSNLTEQLNSLSLNNLMNMIFGQKKGQMLSGSSRVSMDELKGVVRESVELGGQFNYGDYIPIARWLDLTGIMGRMKALHKRMKSIAKELIEEHRERRRITSEVKDVNDITVLDVLLSLKGEDALTDDAITGMLYDMIIAGSDTTSITADWTIAELMRKPELMKKLQSEVDSVVGKERYLKESDLPHLPYLHSVVKESLRMHPPAPLGLPHCSTQATKLAGYDIPAGTTVIINLWAVHRDPKNWPNAEEFRPERFEEHDTNMFGQDFTLLPFSSGRRGCPGTMLGLTAVQLIVASLVHCFDLEPYGMEAVDIDVIHEKPGLTVVRTQDLIVRGVPRLPLHLYK